MSILRLVVVIVLMFTLSGCGVILQGSDQDIEVQTNPTGATVTGGPFVGTYTTPVAVTLERKKNYVLTIEKDGFRTVEVPIHPAVNPIIVVADVVLTALVGVVVDAVTGGWNDLEPDVINATLERDRAMSSLGPDKIDVTIHANKSHDGIEIESTAPVTVSIREE